jgi:hypothetical protein
MRSARLLFAGLVLLAVSASWQADAQAPGHQTSSSCQIGNIKKGATGKHCDVPIPTSCKVAVNTATQTRWTDIEKSGGLSCRFDDKLSDWKTRIAGTCGACQARQCSAKFTVYFDCP